MSHTPRQLLLVVVCLLTLWAISPGGAPAAAGAAGRALRQEATATPLGRLGPRHQGHEPATRGQRVRVPLTAAKPR